MSMKDSVNHYKNLAAEIIRKWNKKTKVAVLSGVLVCFVLSTAFAVNSGTEVYSLSIAGRNAGYITDTALIDKAIGEIDADYAAGETPLDITVDREALTYEKTDLKKEETASLSVKELEKKIIDSGVCSVKAWAVNIGGKMIVAAASKADADQILSGVKNHYLSSGSKPISADFKENVTVTRAAVGVSDVMMPDDAVNLILTGERDPEIYTVKEGDTVWDIAAENGMKVDELQKANPGFDPDRIQIGQQLNLFAVKPFMTVVTKELVSASEKIDFKTVYEETSSLYQGEVRIKTAGVCGTREVSAEVTKENGVVVASTVVSSVVTAEPQNQIALKGTKAAVRYMASRGGSSVRAAAVAAAGSDIVAYAKDFIGVPYVHGGTSPKGFDCSGFTQYVMGHFGGALPRTTAGQYGSGVRVDKSELQQGDLVFFKPTADSSRISHVGIYIGGGKFIHSPQPGESVEISDLSSSYNVKHYYGAVRVTK